MMRLYLLIVLVVVSLSIVSSRNVAHAQSRSRPAATATAKTNLSEAARGAVEAEAVARPEAKPAPGAVPANMPLRAGGLIPTPRLVELEGVTRTTLDAAVPRRVNLAEAAAQAPDEEPEPKVIRPHEPLPQNLPLPPGSVPQAQGPAAQAPAAPPQPSPAVGENFLALFDNGLTIPPDTSGSVGEEHLLVALNSELRVLDRQGVEVAGSRISLDQFWSPLNQPDQLRVFDPRVHYDLMSGRWILVCVANSFSGTSSLLLAASETGDPSGDWSLYRFDADPDDQVWIDYPSVGSNAKWLVVQSNMFTVTEPGSFVRSNIYVFDKQTFFGGQDLTPTLFEIPNIGGTQRPAVTLDEDQETMYLVQNWNGDVNGQGVLRLYAIEGEVGEEQIRALDPFPATSDTWASFPPQGDFAPQADSSNKINTGDSRMQSAVFRGGSLYAIHHVFTPATNPNRCTVQWWQLAPNGTVEQRGRVDDATGTAFFAYPSLAVNGAGDVLIGFSRFSSDSFASAAYAYRAADDPSDQLRTPVVYKEGQAPYFKTFGGGRNRFGDYSSTAVDPVDDSSFWTIQTFAAEPTPLISNRWGTWWAEIPIEVGDQAAKAGGD